jgi:hypothetical protein
MPAHAPDPRPAAGFRMAIVTLLAAAVLATAPVAARRAPKPDPAKPAAPAEKTEPAPTPPQADPTAAVPYVFFVDDATVIQSASPEDQKRARKLREGSEGKVLWFRKEGKEYVVRDPAVLQSILELHASSTKSQEQMRTLRHKDGEQSADMDRLVKEEEDLNARLDGLVEERTRLEADAAKNAEALERLKVEEADLNQELDQRDQQMDQLAESLDTLSADQEKAREEGERGSTRMEEQIRTILDGSIRSGAAKRYRAKA